MTVPHHDLQRLLTAPILPTLLRLAAPNVMAMVMTVLVGIAETYYVGRLGTAPLAAMALVFPFAMLTQMMSAGAMGGGVSAAISRALGASDLPRAHTLLLHALVIGLGAGVLYSAIFLIWGPFFYALLGGQGQVLTEAVRYGQVLFAGALLVWLINTLASIVRGTGNMRAPSVALVATAVLQIALGGVLALGAGPVPAMGMVGVALGHIIATAAGVVYFLWYLVSGQGRLTLKLDSLQLQGRMFADILRCGRCGLPVARAIGVGDFDFHWPVGPKGHGSTGRLRHRSAAGIFVDPHCLRHWRGFGAHGGHGHRCGPGGTGKARRLGGRCRVGFQFGADRCSGHAGP